MAFRVLPKTDLGFPLPSTTKITGAEYTLNPLTGNVTCAPAPGGWTGWLACDAKDSTYRLHYRGLASDVSTPIDLEADIESFRLRARSLRQEAIQIDLQADKLDKLLGIDTHLKSILDTRPECS